jgi:hypothetical protein
MADAMLRHVNDDSCLYHYTSLKRFVEIVTKKEIFASSIYSFNDSLEHFWIRDKALEKLGTYKPEELKRSHTELRDRLLQRAREDIFCFCLSEDGDDLGQWRSYAQNGYGVAIGFDRRFLQALWPIGMLIQVNYNPTDHESWLDNWLKKMDYRETDLSDEDLAMAKVLHSYGISHYASYCKNPKFAAEKEWRLIYRADEDIADTNERLAILKGPEYRDSGPFVVPYYKIAIKPRDGVQSIKQVVFGPN